MPVLTRVHWLFRRQENPSRSRSVVKRVPRALSLRRSLSVLSHQVIQRSSSRLEALLSVRPREPGGTAAY